MKLFANDHLQFLFAQTHLLFPRRLQIFPREKKGEATHATSGRERGDNKRRWDINEQEFHEKYVNICQLKKYSPHIPLNDFRLLLLLEKFIKEQLCEGITNSELREAINKNIYATRVHWTFILAITRFSCFFTLPLKMKMSHK
jgi:hypothetical protein